MKIYNHKIEEILQDSGIEAVKQIHSLVHSSLEMYRGELPQYLKEVRQENIDRIIDQLWGGSKDILPLTIQSIKAKVIDILIIDSSSIGNFLLYVFEEDGIQIGFRGNIPIEKMPFSTDYLSVDLSTFYNMHNGWYEIESNDGLLQAEKFEIFRDPENGETNFLKVFQKGVNAIGFDIDSTKREPFVLWTEDDEVEEISAFWKFIDEWFQIILEDFDNR